MLGEKIGEEHGKVTGRRVLPGNDERTFMKMEVSFETETTMYGVSGMNMGTYEMYFVRSMLNLLDVAVRARLPRDTLAVQLAELWHTVATTPEQENALPRDSVGVAMAREARSDWLEFHPEDNRLQLEAVAAFDALGEVRRSADAPRSRMLLLFMPEDHVTTAESFREFARLANADTVAYASACGHMAPVCETSEIGSHLRAFLDAEMNS